MKSEAPATVASAIPVTVGEPVVVQPRKIPLAAKVAGTAFLAVLVPVYLHTYGPTNFLWFCDAALILTVAGSQRPKSTSTNKQGAGDEVAQRRRMGPVLG